MLSLNELDFFLACSIISNIDFGADDDMNDPVLTFVSVLCTYRCYHILDFLFQIFGPP